MTDITVSPRARELSKEEYDEWVRTAFTDQQTIKDGLQEARGGLWKVAEALYHFAETSGWLALGYDTVGEWLADPDITLTRATYYRCVEAWRELHVIRQVDAQTLVTLDLTKTNITLPALKEGRATLEDALSDIEVLGARDLREKYTSPVGPGATLRTGYEPTGDGLEGEVVDDVEPPIMVMPSEEEAATVYLHTSQMLLGVLLRVRKELGPEERKAMSHALREAIDDAIGFAHDQGLGHVQ
jgi:hypothetical protein